MIEVSSERIPGITCLLEILGDSGDPFVVRLQLPAYLELRGARNPCLLPVRVIVGESDLLKPAEDFQRGLPRDAYLVAEGREREIIQADPIGVRAGDKVERDDLGVPAEIPDIPASPVQMSGPPSRNPASFAPLGSTALP